MRYVPRMRAFLQALVLVALAPKAFAEAPARTMITVVTADWDATTGELRRWDRDGKSWRAVGRPVPVVVGKTGLVPEEKKREGDGASPAGRFALGDVVGYDEKTPRGLKLHYHWSQGRVCVDDPGRPAFYNRVVYEAQFDDREPHFEWMRREDDLYRYTIFVRHNDARVPGFGSCIFLHVWRDAHSPTVGCTAMALDDLRALLAWVEPSTILVQLPRDEYARRQREWGLPPLAQRK